MGTDLMLALNKALEQAGKDTGLGFIWVWYLLSGTIFAQLSEKVDLTQLISQRLNFLIRVVKAIYEISLQRYLGDRNMELLKCEIESFTSIRLKSLPYWLINKN